MSRTATYHATVNWTGGHRGHLVMGNGPEMDFSAPPEAQGHAGVLTPEDAILTAKGLKAHRRAYCDAIRDYHTQGKLAGKMAKWPLRYLIRHTAFHTLDHTWEMEDKDLTVK